MNAPRVGGIYQHYKGGFYRVRGIAEHTENEGQMLVIYQYVSGVHPTDGRTWARPLDGWNTPVPLRWRPKDGYGAMTIDRFFDTGG